ncbi:MAG: ThiF family adenylyltransferase [Rhodobacteraceae bacterium]|nr:ThiF family adenylyltransferase [Paracoccaceae bacterium]
MRRYERQMILPIIGTCGQDRLADAHILIIGAGGLAATSLPLLAGAGIGRLTIMDGDQIELSNLHRQTLFNENCIGRSKAEVAAEQCRALNSEIVIDSIPQNLSPANVSQYTKADLILDCADSYAVSYTLSDFCLANKVPLISASALGLSGYVGGFCGSAPSLRAVFPQAPESGASCSTSGVLGPLVSVLGAMQAQMAFNHLLAIDSPPLGCLIRYDGLDCTTSSFRFDDATEPQSYFRFSAPDLLSDSDFIVDLREITESINLIDPRAQRIPARELTSLRDISPKGCSRRLALCCATGLRAWRIAERFHNQWPGDIVLVAASAS